MMLLSVLQLCYYCPERTIHVLYGPEQLTLVRSVEVATVRKPKGITMTSTYPSFPQRPSCLIGMGGKLYLYYTFFFYKFSHEFQNWTISVVDMRCLNITRPCFGEGGVVYSNISMGVWMRVDAIGNLRLFLVG